MPDLPAGECDCGAEYYKDASPCRKEHLSSCPANALARALERIAELEAGMRRYEGTLITCQNERDEALARLAKSEPPVDPDLVLAREIEARLHAADYVEHVLAGIKAGREAAQVKL